MIRIKRSHIYACFLRKATKNNKTLCGGKEFQWSRNGCRAQRLLIFPSSSGSVPKGFPQMIKSQTMEYINE